MATRTAESWIILKLKGTIANELLVEGGGTAHSAKIEAASLSIHEMLVNGVEADQANRAMVLLGRSIAPGATVDIDLYDWATHDIGSGAGKDALGLAAVFEEICCIIVKHAGGDGQLEIMGSVPGVGPAGWVPRLTSAAGSALLDGGCMVLYQPDDVAFDVYDGVSHILRLGAVDDFVSFDLYVLGRSEDDVSSSSTSSSSSRSSSSVSSSSSSTSTAIPRTSSSTSSASSSTSSCSTASSSSSSSSTSTRSSLVFE